MHNFFVCVRIKIQNLEMGKGENWGWQPSGSPTVDVEKSDVHWSHFDSSVNAVSFGFVATAVLISMFLVMAIFEKFLRPSPPQIPPSRRRDIESQLGFYPKLGYSSPKVSLFTFFDPSLLTVTSFFNYLMNLGSLVLESRLSALM